MARAREVSLRGKEAKWLEWCASFSHHTSLSQLWRSVRTASGTAPSRTPAPTSRGRKARGCFHLQRCSSDKLPPQTRRLQQQLWPLRDETIREATEVTDATSQPFSLQNLWQAKKRGGDTATGADGVTYSMLALVGPAGDAALLNTLNASWLMGCLPPI